MHVGLASGVLKALLLEKNRQLSCNLKRKNNCGLGYNMMMAFSGLSMNQGRHTPQSNTCMAEPPNCVFLGACMTAKPLGGGLNAYCMHIRPLFLRTSGSSGVLKALLLERNGQLSCNPKKKKNTS